MPSFGKTSELALQGVHPDLVAFLRKLVEHWDFTVLNGRRTEEQQKDYVHGTNFTGVNPEHQILSQTMNSKHLPQADGFAHAVDVAPYPQRWGSAKFEKQQLYFAGFAMGFAAATGFALRSGEDFNQDNDPTNDGFNDADHLEMK